MNTSRYLCTSKAVLLEFNFTIVCVFTNFEESKSTPIGNVIQIKIFIQKIRKRRWNFKDKKMH